MAWIAAARTSTLGADASSRARRRGRDAACAAACAAAEPRQSSAVQMQSHTQSSSKPSEALSFAEGKGRATGAAESARERRSARSCLANIAGSPNPSIAARPSTAPCLHIHPSEIAPPPPAPPLWEFAAFTPTPPPTGEGANALVGSPPAWAFAFDPAAQLEPPP